MTPIQDQPPTPQEIVAASTPVERPYTMALRLCDGQRIDMPLLNRLRALGGHKPYPEDADIQCTGSAHLAGEHILCTSPVHGVVGKPLNGWQTVTVTNDALPERPEAVSNPLPEDLERVLADPSIVTPGDEKMHALIAAHARQHLDERVPAAAYLNLFVARAQGAEAENDRFRAALEQIAASPRPDGTYNLSREACEEIAREALRRGDT